MNRRKVEPKKYLGRGEPGDPMITSGCSQCGLVSGHTVSCPNKDKIEPKKPSPLDPDTRNYY